MLRTAQRAILLPLVAAVFCGMLRPQKTPVPNQPLKLERAIPLPSVQGRIDHLAADVDGKRIFIAALGNGTVEVVDLDATLIEDLGFEWQGQRRAGRNCKAHMF